METAKILVIIPAYNEEGNIGRVLAEFRNMNFLYDVVVVNDGSIDQTEEIVIKNQVKVISHPINLGAGAAIQTGLKYALKNKYDIVVVVDGDGQHDPKEIPSLIGAFENISADLVIGSRFLKNNTAQIHWVRRIGISIFSRIASMIGNYKITDTTSGFRAFNKRAIKFLAVEMPVDFPDSDMLLSLLFSGFIIVEVPVSVRQRTGGHSMYTMLRSFYYPFKIIIAILAVMLRNILKGRRQNNVG